MKKRIGRPFVEPKDGKRAPLGLKITAAMKRRIDAEAKATGRTQSMAAELMLEKAFWLEDLLRARLISARVPAIGKEAS